MKRLIFVIALLAMSGCTTTQINDGTQWAAGQIITNALDIAFGSDKKYEREYEKYEQTKDRSCYPFCEYKEEARSKAESAERERRKRRAESRAFKADFDAYMAQLEETQQYEAAGSPVLAE